MKRLLLIAAIALTGCGPDPEYATNQTAPVPEDGCVVSTSSKLVAKQQVGKITNLVTEEEEFGTKNICTVKFNIVVDGKNYHVEETESGLEQMASICYYAREKGKRELLLDLGGDFQSETTVACRSSEKNG